MRDRAKASLYMTKLDLDRLIKVIEEDIETRIDRRVSADIKSMKHQMLAPVQQFLDEMKAKEQEIPEYYTRYLSNIEVWAKKYLDIYIDPRS